MQNTVRAFVEQYGISCGVLPRFIDLSSETGELGKAILKSTDYGASSFQPDEASAEEAGDCLFSLLALMCEMNLDAEEALRGAIAKYERRITQSGTLSSGK